MNALITGGSRGIGKAVAEALLLAGYNTVLVSRTESDLKKTANELSEKFPERKVIFFAGDVTDDDWVSKIVNQAESEVGPITFAFNNAGIYRLGSADLSAKDFDEIVRVNLLGCANIARAVFPRMMKRKTGYLINVSSVCGKKGFAGTGAYSASKYGLLGLNDALFRESAGTGVKVTAICPSWVNTEMADGSHVPREKMIQTEDIAKTVLFLLSLSDGVAPKEMVLECMSDIL